MRQSTGEGSWGSMGLSLRSDHLPANTFVDSKAIRGVLELTTNPVTPTTMRPCVFCETRLPIIHSLPRSVTSKSVSASAISLLGDGQLDTLALRQRDPRLLRADDEDVALTGSEGVVNSILQVDNGETTIVLLTVSDNTNTTHVTTTNDHGKVASVELDVVGDLASGKVDLDSVVDLDQGIRVADTMSRGVSKEGE